MKGTGTPSMGWRQEGIILESLWSLIEPINRSPGEGQRNGPTPGANVEVAAPESHRPSGSQLTPSGTYQVWK